LFFYKLYRYYIVQLVAIFIDYTLFLFLLANEFNNTQSFIIAKVISASFSFYLHYTKTFPSSSVSLKGKFLYVIQHLVSPSLTSIIFWIIESLVSQSLISKLISDLMVGTLNFFIMNFLIFKQKT